MRFGTEIITGIQQVCGDDFPVGFTVNFPSQPEARAEVLRGNETRTKQTRHP